jgi:CcmD family protein
MMMKQDKETSAPAAGTPDDRATDFRAVEGTPAEQFSGGRLLVEAYAAIWVILLAWIFLLWRKQASLAQRLDGLEAAIDRADKKAAAAKKI